ncbi:MAG: hypothetical protein JEY79_11875 [Pseudodesulfovibrio sp.]|nr:hypothetical protein [Pseudodesulfovibrio sp.]
MRSSIFDVMDFPELRLWALRALVQNETFISSADGTLFLPGECGYQIFTAMRSVVESGEKMIPTIVAQYLGYDSPCLRGLVDVFFHGANIDARMAQIYLDKLAVRSEQEAEYAA